MASRPIDTRYRARRGESIAAASELSGAICPEGETSMRTRLLIMAVALASVFTVQQAAVAKTNTHTTSMNKKKHHKKHNMKKTAVPAVRPATVA
jgi:hypothetical protein